MSAPKAIEFCFQDISAWLVLAAIHCHPQSLGFFIACTIDIWFSGFSFSSNSASIMWCCLPHNKPSSSLIWAWGQPWQSYQFSFLHGKLNQIYNPSHGQNTMDNML